MSVIFHVLKEEFERLQETESSYIKAIAEMPRGAPRIQQRRNKRYLYLEYREGKKVISNLHHHSNLLLQEFFLLQDISSDLQA